MTRIAAVSESQPSLDYHRWGVQLVDELPRFDREARAHPRTKLTIEARARASNRRGTVFGTPYSVVTTDISPAGLGFLHTTAVPGKFLIIELRTKQERRFVLVEVVRCRSVGDFFEVGAKFIRLIESL